MLPLKWQGDLLPIEAIGAELAPNNRTLYPLVILFLGLSAFQGLYDLDSSFADNSNSEYDASTMLNFADDLIGLAVVIANAEFYLKMATMELGEPLAVSPEELLDRNSGGRYILFCLSLVEFFSLLTGFGVPYEGNDFKKGSKKLEAILDFLNPLAHLDENEWFGVAADSCDMAGETLKRHVKKLATWDRDMAAVATRHARIVLHTRTALGILKALLLVGFIDKERYSRSGNIEIAQYIDLRVGKLGAAALLAILLVLPAALSEASTNYANKISDRYLSQALKLKKDMAGNDSPVRYLPDRFGPQEHSRGVTEKISVSSEYLDNLTEILHGTVAQVESAKRATAEAKNKIEWGWGPLFRATNDAFGSASAERQHALGVLSAACAALGVTLAAAGSAYTASDALLGVELGEEEFDFSTPRCVVAELEDHPSATAG